jgi:uncharacterized protein YdaU (DUF1376 family)
MKPEGDVVGKSSDKAPAFQFYVKDYETDENVKLMSLAQEGAFLRLLCHQWLHRSIPTNIDALARICRCSRAEFESLWPGIEPCFESVAEGRVTNARLERQRTELDGYLEGQSIRGSNGAAKRWGKQTNGGAMSAPFVGRDDATRPPQANDSSASSSVSASNTRRDEFGPRLINRSACKSHAFCGRVCVPDFLHKEFIKALGGDEQKASKRLGEFYLDEMAKWPEGDVPPSDAMKFWRPRFDAKFAANAGKPAETKRTVKGVTETTSYLDKLKAGGQ